MLEEFAQPAPGIVAGFNQAFILPGLLRSTPALKERVGSPCEVFDRQVSINRCGWAQSPPIQWRNYYIGRGLTPSFVGRNGVLSATPPIAGSMVMSE